ncbi:hypothetical protein HDV05_007348 [Chytridiales sp. JEL 0842]|nr:hypothetical protein HDV05_007348 [Chytridiales sp. JEL 0842]
MVPPPAEWPLWVQIVSLILVFLLSFAILLLVFYYFKRRRAASANKTAGEADLEKSTHAQSSPHVEGPVSRAILAGETNDEDDDNRPLATIQQQEPPKPPQKAPRPDRRDSISKASSSTVGVTPKMNETKVAIMAFVSRQDDEIGVAVGDPLGVYHSYEDGWSIGINWRTGLSGIFPTGVIDPNFSSTPTKKKSVLQLKPAVPIQMDHQYQYAQEFETQQKEERLRVQQTLNQQSQRQEKNREAKYRIRRLPKKMLSTASSILKTLTSPLRSAQPAPTSPSSSSSTSSALLTVTDNLSNRLHTSLSQVSEVVLRTKLSFKSWKGSDGGVVLVCLTTDNNNNENEGVGKGVVGMLVEMGYTVFVVCGSTATAAQVSTFTPARKRKSGKCIPILLPTPSAEEGGDKPIDIQDASKRVTSFLHYYVGVEIVEGTVRRVLKGEAMKRRQGMLEREVERNGGVWDFNNDIHVIGGRGQSRIGTLPVVQSSFSEEEEEELYYQQTYRNQQVNHTDKEIQDPTNLLLCIINIEPPPPPPTTPLELLNTQNLLNSYTLSTLLPLSLTTSFLPLLRESQGRVLNLCNALSGGPMMGERGVGRGGWNGVVEGLRVEVFGFGISVSIIEVGLQDSAPSSSSSAPQPTTPTNSRLQTPPPASPPAPAKRTRAGSVSNIPVPTRHARFHSKDLRTPLPVLTPLRSPTSSASAHVPAALEPYRSPISPTSPSSSQPSQRSGRLSAPPPSMRPTSPQLFRYQHPDSLPNNEARRGSLDIQGRPQTTQPLHTANHYPDPFSLGRLRSSTPQPTSTPGRMYAHPASSKKEDGGNIKALYTPLLKTIQDLASPSPMSSRETIDDALKRAVLHAFLDEYPKTRYRVGWDVRVGAGLKWVLPERVLDWGFGVLAEREKKTFGN